MMTAFCQLLSVLFLSKRDGEHLRSGRRGAQPRPSDAGPVLLRVSLFSFHPASLGRVAPGCAVAPSCVRGQTRAGFARSHGGWGGVYADCSPPTCSYEGLSLCVCCNSTAPASRRAMSSAYDPSESLFANAWIKTDVSALALCCKRGPVPLAAVAFTASFGWTVWEQSLSCGASLLQHGWQAVSGAHVGGCVSLATARGTSESKPARHAQLAPLCHGCSPVCVSGTAVRQ